MIHDRLKVGLIELTYENSARPDIPMKDAFGDMLKIMRWLSFLAHCKFRLFNRSDKEQTVHGV